MQEQTELNGISYTIPNTLSPDGDTLILTNLRKKDNALRPVSKGTLIGELGKPYDLIYIHPIKDNQNWIGTINSDLYTNILSSTPQKITSLNSRIQRICHIANTLIALTSTGLYYFLYKNGNYISLGDKPASPYLSFHYLVSYSFLKFSQVEGEITDLQAAMESLHIKNRWRENNSYSLCGAYLLTYAIRLYDNTYICPSSPQFIYPSFGLTPSVSTTLAYRGDTFYPEYSSVQTSLYRLKCTLHITSQILRWKDIIAGIDIFISQELGAFSDTFKKIEECKQTITNNPEQHVTLKKFYPLDFSKQTILNNIQEVTNFYLIKTIPLPKNPGELTVNLPENNDISNLQTLVHQTTLPIDNFTHHTLTAGNSYIYNQRLHLADITTTFFQGFQLQAFSTYFRQVTDNSAGGTITRPGITPDQPEPQNITKAYIEIYINTSEQNDKWVTTCVENLTSHFLNPFFSYPDPRACKAIIIYTDSYDNILRKKELLLTPHPHLNIAFYIDPSLQEITIPEVTPLLYHPVFNVISAREEAKIKVSALQNPFVFLNENTYVASSRVLGMATNTRPLSEGQFGQFPLYVFTVNGVYALHSGGGDTLYSNIVPVSQEIALPGTITPVTDAVFFLTSRGGFLISAAQIVPISPQLDAARPTQNMQFWEKIITVTFPEISDFNFQKLIKQRDITIHHNYLHDEIILVSCQAGYAFIFNLKSRSWHTVTYTFSKIENSYPRLYGTIGNKVYNISEENGEATPVLLLTRPIKFKTQQFKTLIRQILRCKITNFSNAAFFIYVSNDAENFRLKQDTRIPPGSHIDLDTGLITNCKYRYFALLFIATLDSESQINYLQSNYLLTYHNDKLR